MCAFGQIRRLTKRVQHLYWSDDSEASSAQPITVAQFHGDSYTVVPLRRAPSRSLSFEIWFLTFEPNGKPTSCHVDMLYRYSLLRPGRGAAYCDQPVCLSVCASVCLSASISLEPLQDQHEILCADPLWPWLGPTPVALRYVIYFRFHGWRHVWP